MLCYLIKSRKVYKEAKLKINMEFNIKTTLTKEEEKRWEELKIIFNEKTNSKLLKKIIKLKFIIE